MKSKQQVSVTTKSIDINHVLFNRKQGYTFLSIQNCWLTITYYEFSFIIPPTHPMIFLCKPGGFQAAFIGHVECVITKSSGILGLLVLNGYEWILWRKSPTVSRIMKDTWGIMMDVCLNILADYLDFALRLKTVFDYRWESKEWNENWVCKYV